jgi:D-arabinose 5-phosphate isomerase GutQ
VPIDSPPALIGTKIFHSLSQTGTISGTVLTTLTMVTKEDLSLIICSSNETNISSLNVLKVFEMKSLGDESHSSPKTIFFVVI